MSQDPVSLEACLAHLEPKPDYVIVYDGECPVCARFFPSYLRLLSAGKRAAIVDARSVAGLPAALWRERGIDIDRDAAMLHRGRWYEGALALSVLFQSAASPSPRVAAAVTACFEAVYPALRVGRLLLLRLLGRKPIAAHPPRAEPASRVRSP